MNNADLTALIIKLIFVVLSTWITVYLAPYLKTLSEKNNDEKLKKFIKELVKAAEQTIKGSGQGAAKLELVTEQANAWLKKNNISISDEDLRALIESLVYDLNQMKEAVVND